MGHFDQRSHLIPKNHSPKEFFEHAIILDSLSKVLSKTYNGLKYQQGLKYHHGLKCHHGEKSYYVGSPHVWIEYYGAHVDPLT